MASSIVHVVHCVDTEGPLDESLDALFERVNLAYDLSLEASNVALKQLQSGTHPLVVDDEIAAQIAVMVSPELREYLSDWSQIEKMLTDALSTEFRDRYPDSFGKGWLYNWFCLDHVGFSANPRGRVLGFHEVFDWYRRMLAQTGSGQDGVHFHHHPVPFSLSAHHSGTNYLSFKPTIFEILCRRIIDRGWFPEVFRPGFHTIRPDSHWLLEQYIPFDYSNQSKRASSEPEQIDLVGGRYGDWRRAPRDWTPYHPHHDDYQQQGSCRRWIARCLNVGTRFRLLEEADVEEAFEQATAGKPVVLAIANHDYRDIRSDVEAVWRKLQSVGRRYPGVKFKYGEAGAAMRSAMDLHGTTSLHLEFRGNKIVVESVGPIFGPQPFLAIKTYRGEYFHDNFDLQDPERLWSYTFDESTIPIDDVISLGIAANCPAGKPQVISWTR